MLTREEFIYYSTKKGTNTMKTTTFWITGIGILKTREKVKEAIRKGMPIKMKCKITGDCHEADYINHKWIKI